MHTEPWRSAADDPELTLERLLQDVAKGHAFELQGGEQEARQRWQHLVAAGKLGISQPPGKKPRLLGDGSISGSNSRSCIRETVSLPTLECIRRLLSLFPAGDEWCAFSFDVRGAHKLVLVRDDEEGLSCFVLKGRWFVYRTCYFGCKWAAYWFSRVGGFLVRNLHRFIWVAHALLRYSDDGLELFPVQVAPLSASISVMFLAALGVPLSWDLRDQDPLDRLALQLVKPLRCFARGQEKDISTGSPAAHMSGEKSRQEARKGGDRLVIVVYWRPPLAPALAAGVLRTPQKATGCFPHADTVPVRRDR